MKTIHCSFILIIIFILFYLIPVNTRLLWQPDETRYAEISREMLSTRDWVVPHFLGLRYLEKPIVGYWINSLSQLIFGNSNFAVRAGSVLSIFLTLLLVIWFTWQICENQYTAFLAGVIFLTFLIVCGVGTYAVFDSMISFFLMAAMCSFWLSAKTKNFSKKIRIYLLLGVFCGVGVITKGFIALVIPVFSVLPWIIYKKHWKEVLIFSWFSIVSCILSILPWGMAIANKNINFWHYFFWVEHVQRFFKNNAQHLSPFWFYLPCLLVGSLPWIGLLPGAIYHSLFEKDIQQRDSLIYLLGWVVMPLLFFSLSKGKLITYILPCFSPLSILIANYATYLMKTQNFLSLKINSTFNIGLGMLGVVTVLLLSPLGLVKHPFWISLELNKVFYALIAFLIWCLVGWLSLKKVFVFWWLSAFCPVGVALLVDNVIPNKIMYFKQPNFLVKTIHHSLVNSRFILTNNVGIAAGLAWELKRNDIIMYEYKGELQYGLRYSDVKERYISKKNFSSWLKKHRYQGKVSLILLLSKNEDFHQTNIPKPDNIFFLGNIVYLEYFIS